MALSGIEGPVAPRTMTILGATGSIGVQTLDIVERAPEEYAIEALTANSKVEELVALARRIRPTVAVIADDARYQDLKDGLAGSGIEAAAGGQALVEAAERPADFVMAGIVGYAGLAPTLAAARRGAVIGLANKECLVCAGDILTAALDRSGGRLLPVDSEHSAIFQVFDFDQADRVSRIILTASGGPFRERPRADLANVTPAEAVAHPNWTMGAKISVDSATMMNKGLEVIEAGHIFPVDNDRIEIVVHPQSVIHSMVEYVDASVLAQLGTPDMRTPIAYALGWPERVAAPAARLDFSNLGALTFEAPDEERFPAIRLARQALDAGGSAPIVLNAANEVAVYSFLDNGVGFLDITDVVEETLTEIEAAPAADLDEIVAVDAAARRAAESAVARRTGGSRAVGGARR